MTTQIGSPYTPPDGTLLDISSGGQLEIKPQTRGDLLLAGVSGIFAPLNIGASGKYLQSDGTDASWQVPPGQGWTFIELLQPSAAASATTASMAAYDQYLVIWQLTASAASNHEIRVNGSSANYTKLYITGTTVTSSSAQTGVLIGGGTTTGKCSGCVLLDGITRAVASGEISFAIWAGLGSTFRGLSGTWNGGNATQVTTITITTNTGTITGKISVYGRNF